MFGSFGSLPECPVDQPTKDWIDRRMEWLISEFGIDRLRLAQVILPTPAWFPEDYIPSKEGAHVILNKVCRYMGLDSAIVNLHFYEEGKPDQHGNLTLGTTGLYQEVDGAFSVGIEINNLDDPLALVATIAHELAHVHLLGHERITPDADDHEWLTDLLTVFLGLGVIVANSVIRESYWDLGGMSGWSMSRRGYMSMPMYGYALALFARAREEDQPAWAGHLRLDVRSAFQSACRFLAEGGKIESGLESSPSDPDLLSDFDESQATDACTDTEGDVTTADELQDRYNRGERDFRDVDFSGIRLSGVNLHGSDLSDADLCECDLTNAVLAKTIIRDANFRRAILKSADLKNSDLNGADFRDADLTGTDLTGADIRNANFTDAVLDQVVLTGTLRDRSTNFLHADLSRVVCDVDLTKEVLRGDIFSEMIAYSLLISVLAAVVGGLFGALLGELLGRMLGDQGITALGGIAGALLFGGFAMWKFVWGK